MPTCAAHTPWGHGVIEPVIVLPFLPILPVLPRLESQHVFWYDRPQKAAPAIIPFAGSVSYSAQGTGGGGLIQQNRRVVLHITESHKASGIAKQPTARAGYAAEPGRYHHGDPRHAEGVSMTQVRLRLMTSLLVLASWLLLAGPPDTS